MDPKLVEDQLTNDVIFVCFPGSLFGTSEGVVYIRLEESAESLDAALRSALSVAEQCPTVKVKKVEFKAEDLRGL